MKAEADNANFQKKLTTVVDDEKRFGINFLFKFEISIAEHNNKKTNSKRNDKDSGKFPISIHNIFECTIYDSSKK